MSDMDGLSKYKPTDERFVYERFPIYWIARVSSLYTQRMEKVLKRSGVTMTAWRILMVLREHRSLSISKLSLHCSFNLSTVTKTVYSMQKKSLVLVRQSEADGRVSKVTLVKKGRTLIKQLIADTSEIIDALMEGMTEEEVLKINEVFQKITARLADY